MTRPAIVIGLGGTGQWVLTFLKKELLEVGDGTMPKGVRLLAFDTTSMTTAITGHGGRRADEQAVRAGAVELAQGTEFIPIGDNVTKLATEIANGDHPHLQWFPAKTYLGKLPPAAFNTKEGSGQIRQMGRISLFRDLSAVLNSQILSQLRSALQDLQRDVSRDRQLEIIIIGSLAGGTGAGMLVDMALLARAQAARLVSNNYVVRGFFVLPRAFTSGGLAEDRDMLARSFAAWRELDRFMIVSERFGLRQINYHSQNQDLRLRIDKRAYDVSYMVDPARQTANSLDNVKAEEGLYPALAHCVSAILDEKAGKAYTEFVSTNLSGKLAQLPRRPYHSAIGSYTLKVPVYYAREKFSHQLALEVLKIFLAPDVNERGRVTRVSELRNREVPDGYAGRLAVNNFFGASALNLGGQEIPNTGFLPIVADVRQREGQREGSIIIQWARGGLTTANNRVLAALTNISQDEEGKLISRDITEILQRAIWADAPPSRTVGDKPDQAYSRITNKIVAVRQEYYGLETVEGEQLRGKYGKALEKAKNAQIARFRKLLQAWTEIALNGQAENATVARGGKIGYVRACYQEMISTFTYFIGFLDKVRQQRNEVDKVAARAQEAARKAMMFYQQEKGKQCFIPFWDDFVHPDAHKAQRNYLQAEQRSINVRKDDILLSVLAETAAEMQVITERTLEDLDNWIAHLATGAPGVTSLYTMAADSLSNVLVNHELDRRLSRVSELIGEHEYKSDAKFITEALNALVWKVEAGVERLQVQCGVVMPAATPDAPPQYHPFRRQGEKPAEANLEMLLHLAERPYTTLHQERPLAREVVKVYNTGGKLAHSVDKKAEPLYTYIPTARGPEIVACYIRVHSDLDDATTQYFRDYGDTMRELNRNIKGSSLTLVDSEDPHKMTIVRSDDLVPSTDFDMWHTCREAYIRQVTDPHKGIPAAELHVFPAEINACYYESRMPILLRKDFRTLHPEVVALVEDRERLEMFFRGKALGFIRRTESAGNPYWIYQLPGDEPLHVTVTAEALQGRQQDDLFQVIHNFVMEGRDQRPGVGNALQVQWGRLRQAILSTQRELGPNQVIELYRNEIDKGLVKDIENDVEVRRNAIPDEAQRKTIGQEHDDLADLARVIYLEAIESVRSFQTAPTQASRPAETTVSRTPEA